MDYNKIIFGDTTIIDLTADTVTADKIISGYTAHAANGASIQGTIQNRGAINGVISSVSGTYAVPEGYHNGAGKVAIASSEQAKIIPENIKQGITILGVIGNAQSSTPVTTQSKTITPSITTQNVSPDEEYDYLSSVTIEPIPYESIPNNAGGTTIIIGEEV